MNRSGSVQFRHGESGTNHVLRDHFGKIPGLDQTIMDAIRGHRSQEVSNTYGKGFRIEKLNEIVSSIDFLLIDK